MSQFADLARSLLTLEINTVLKSGMSAEKMPLAGDALIDIAQEYYVFLCEQLDVFGNRQTQALDGWAARLSESFDWGLAPFAAPAGASKAERYAPDFTTRDLPGNDPARGTTFEVLKAIREVASWLREMQDRTQDAAGNPGAPPELVTAAGRIDRDAAPVMMRIQRNCDQIADILVRRGLDKVNYQRGMKDDVRRMAELKTADIVTLRKAWDVGTEVVVMQSTIQIDGDVVTRVLKGRDTATNGTMIGVHRDAVDVSFRYWSFMVEALGRFAGKAVNSLVGDTG
ncbi:hypothetical protein [Azospirillum sp. sgz302134]